jgi:GT2 family glycosyltransferase
MTKISTIIVTYNGVQWIEKCLKSLMKSNVKTEIIIVDNASSDATVEIIRSQFPSTHILQQQQNVGFGKANNIGLSYALENGADFVFLLNQDTIVQENVLDSLVYVLKGKTNLGIASPIHLNWKGDALEYYFSQFAKVNPKFSANIPSENPSCTFYEVPFVNAAAWLIPRAVLESVGGFDPIFKHYGEDNNYCQRLKHHGYSLGIAQNCYIQHDSNIRKEPANYLFSKSYFHNEVKNFQLKYGDINRSFKSKDIRFIRWHNLKLVIRNVLKLNFKNVGGYIKKYMIFEKEIKSIKNSRILNLVKGAHYLEN